MWQYGGLCSSANGWSPMRLIAILALLTATPAAAQDLWFSPDDPAKDLRSRTALQADPEAPITAALPSEPPGLRLDVPLSVEPQPKPSLPNASVVGAAAPSSSQPPATPSRLRVEAGIGFTVANQGPVSLSATLIGTDSSRPAPVTLSTHRPFATPADMRTPEREFGIAASYRIGALAGAQVSFDGRLDVIRQSTTDKPEQQGIAGFRLGF
jgi:hypothetical protein